MHLRVALLLAAGGLLLTPAFAVGALVPVGPAPAVPIASPFVAYHNISYNASSDGFPLSYLEFLPRAFNGSATYPLAVFLHGIGTSTTWVKGGVGSLVDIAPSFTIPYAAVSASMIMIVLNTRSATGFFSNTPCGGPQEQDVLDAVAHEKAHRHVGSVYLVGFSMGSMGGFGLIADHPGVFAGMASVGTISDAFEADAYDASRGYASTAWQADMCLPLNVSTKNATLDSLFLHLSQLRFDPTAFAGMPLYVVAGSKDIRAPNNFSNWPYAEGNSTFDNSTCHVVTSYGEPANCTTTFATLHKGVGGSKYDFRFVWEPFGRHSASAFPAADAFAFLLGLEKGGYYESLPPYHTVFP